MRRTIVLIPGDPDVRDYNVAMNPSVPDVEGRYSADSIDGLLRLIQDNLQRALGTDVEHDIDKWLERNVTSVVVTIDW